MGKRTAILIINHTSVLKLYQKKLECLSRHKEFDFTLLAPDIWPESGFPTKIEKTSDPNYRIEVGRTFFSGSGTRYFFREKIGKLIKEVQPRIIDLVEEPWSAVSAQALYYRNRYAPQAKLVFHTSRTQLVNYPLPFPYFEKKFLHAAAYGICRSEKARQLLLQQGFKGPTAVITHGVDLTTFRPLDMSKLKQRLGLKDAITIAYIGGIKKEKGLTSLVEALAKIPSDFNFLVVGSGPFETELKDLVTKNKLRDKTFFVPSVPQPQVTEYLNLADILVLPSLTTPKWEEMFGRILTEAMAVGVALIGSNSGEIPQVIGDAGLIFPEGSVNELTQALNLLINNPSKRQELVELGRKRVESYSWEAMAAKIYEIYKELLRQDIAGETLFGKKGFPPAPLS